MSTTETCFFLPEPDSVLASLPTSMADYWEWQRTASQITPYWGRYHWILQTCLYLKQAGLPVVLSNAMPRSGVIVSHLDCVPYDFKPSADQYLVIMLVDREVPHPRARRHVLHNPTQHLPLGLRYSYMPPWPQVGLVPRDASRGDRFETLGYFGYPNNLDPGITADAFQAQIRSIGLQMQVPSPADWHDFSGIDCIMAIRNFGRAEPHLNKPTLKLLNAWLAGVPAVLGHETACREEGMPGSGYLEATTPAELLDALRLLKADPAKRRALVDCGRAALGAFQVERTVERWRHLLQHEVPKDFGSRLSLTFAALGRGALGALRERVLWRRPGWFQ
jgi:hypothetical protein